MTPSSSAPAVTSNLDLVNIGVNGSTSTLTINDGTLDFTRFVTTATQRATLNVNGGTVTFDSLANGNGLFMDAISFNLSAANVTVGSNFNISDAPNVDFSLASGFTPIAAGGSFTVLNQAATDVTLLSNPGYTAGQQFTLISSSNAGNNVLNNGTPNAFLGGFGGTYTLENVGNDIVLNVVTAPVPEPATFGLIAVAGLGVLALRRRRRQTA